MSVLIDVMLPLAAVAALTKPLGRYMARVYDPKKPVWLERKLGGLERLAYRAAGIDPKEEMSWRGYALSVLALGAAGFGLLFLILIGQGALPLNPQHLPGLPAHLAFNAAASFITNTNWQSYSGEATLSYFSQMVGLVVQNFLSAATGMAVAVAFFRAFCRKQTSLLGNAWADIVRGTLYILLPLSLFIAALLVTQGVVQTFKPYASYSALESAEGAEPQQIALGPVASQVAIKMLGSNGGGFFNTNSAHPFENPTTLSNLLQVISILLIPAGLVYTFGIMAGDRRQSLMLLATMGTILVPLMGAAIYSEHRENPRFEKAIIDQRTGNMEGKETRFGATASAMWAVATTATSNGSVNSMHDSFTPLGGMIPLIFIQFGEVIFGGVGSGAYGMIIYVILTVFIGGLMVGRTPEYLGKKLGPYEIKMASLCILIPAALVLGGSALCVVTEAGRAGIFNPGAQGFTEVLYAVASASNNNGSAMAGLSANSTFYNILLGCAMLIGRFGIILPTLALAGAIAQKNTVPEGPGTLPTHTPLFVAMLVGSILMLDVLTYVPALALGPIAEHMHLYHAAGGVK